MVLDLDLYRADKGGDPEENPRKSEQALQGNDTSRPNCRGGHEMEEM